MEERAVTLFREYLRIPSVHPDVDYDKCVQFLKRLANEIGLPCNVYDKVHKPVVVITWQGTDKNVGSIMLNSHTDVVPVNKENWTYDPFGGHKDDQGNIYGRGAQDDKCIGIQYLEAVSRLKKDGVKPKRTVHIVFVPEEEIGSAEGMCKFVETENFKKLNVAFALDEGFPWIDDTYIILNEGRSKCNMKVKCKGPAGHGSLFHHNTAGEQFHKVLDAFMDFRESQVKKISECDHQIFNLAEVTTINLTKIQGGIQNNVVPPEMCMEFDIRFSVNIDHEEFFTWVKKICSNAGENVTYEVSQHSPKIMKTPTDIANPFWMAFKDTMDKMGLKTVVLTNPAESDARFLRKIGIPAFGFSPMINTKILLHEDNEHLNEKVFLAGIDIYKNLIKSFINV